MVPIKKMSLMTLDVLDRAGFDCFRAVHEIPGDILVAVLQLAAHKEHGLPAEVLAPLRHFLLAEDRADMKAALGDAMVVD